MFLIRFYIFWMFKHLEPPPLAEKHFILSLTPMPFSGDQTE